MKRQKQTLQLTEATIKIQRKLRATLSMQANRKDFMEQKEAAVMIQRFRRGFVAMRLQKTNYELTIERIVWIHRFKSLTRPYLLLTRFSTKKQRKVKRQHEQH